MCVDEPGQDRGAREVDHTIRVRRVPAAHALDVAVVDQDPLAGLRVRERVHAGGAVEGPHVGRLSQRRGRGAHVRSGPSDTAQTLGSSNRRPSSPRGSPDRAMPRTDGARGAPRSPPRDRRRRSPRRPPSGRSSHPRRGSHRRPPQHRIGEHRRNGRTHRKPFDARFRERAQPRPDLVDAGLGRPQGAEPSRHHHRRDRRVALPYIGHRDERRPFSRWRTSRCQRVIALVHGSMTGPRADPRPRHGSRVIRDPTHVGWPVSHGRRCGRTRAGRRAPARPAFARPPPLRNDLPTQRSRNGGPVVDRRPDIVTPRSIRGGAPRGRTLHAAALSRNRPLRTRAVPRPRCPAWSGDSL